VSRLISPDRRGGGGDGGLEAVAPTGRGRSLFSNEPGVCGRLGILKGLAETEGIVVVAKESGLRNASWSPVLMWDNLPLGGDCGGCIITEGGGRRGFGLRGGGGRILGDRNTPSSTTVMDGIFNMDRGLDFGNGGGAGELSRVLGLPSRRSRTPAADFGVGDIGRGGAVGGVATSFALFMFSKCDRSDETGFYTSVRTDSKSDGGETNNGRAILPILIGLVHISGGRRGRVARDNIPMLPNNICPVSRNRGGFRETSVVGNLPCL